MGLVIFWSGRGDVGLSPYLAENESWAYPLLEMTGRLGLDLH